MSYFSTTFNLLVNAFFDISKQLREVEKVEKAEQSSSINGLQKIYDETKNKITSHIDRSTALVHKLTDHEKKARIILRVTSAAIAKEICELRHQHTFEASARILELEKKLDIMLARQNFVIEASKKAKADKVQKEAMKAQLEAMKVCAQFLKTYEGYTTELLNEDFNSFNLKKNTAEERSDQALAELLHEESLLPSTSPKKISPKQQQRAKKNRSQSKIQKEKSTEPTRPIPSTISSTLLTETAAKPTSINTLAKQIMELNSENPSIYRLHGRVKRWKLELITDADFEAIKRFADYSKGIVSYPYAKLDNCRLKYQRDAHNVGWAQRIISGPLANKYSFDHRYSKSQSGKALVASLISGDEKKTGLIVLGIGDDHIIYHGKLRLFAKEDIIFNKLTPFAKLLKIDPLTSPINEEEDKSSSEPLQETTSVKFSLIDNDIIEIKVMHSKIKQTLKKALAKSETATYYHVYPLV
jgi:hypothetical protein